MNSWDRTAYISDVKYGRPSYEALMNQVEKLVYPRGMIFSFIFCFRGMIFSFLGSRVLDWLYHKIYYFYCVLAGKQ